MVHFIHRSAPTDPIAHIRGNNKTAVLVRSYRTQNYDKGKATGKDFADTQVLFETGSILRSPEKCNNEKEAEDERR